MIRAISCGYWFWGRLAMFNVLVTRQLPGKGLERLKEIANVELNVEDRVLTGEELLRGDE
ncbi:MAG: hypothetical protein QG670_1859 [Thermoproteota archaeon]|nr:hypothetical protein [Thermoproteota archaeon]